MEYPEIVKRIQEERDGLHEGKITLTMAGGVMAWLRQKIDPRNWELVTTDNPNVTVMHKLYMESMQVDVTPARLNLFDDKLTNWLIEQPITICLVIDYHPQGILWDLAQECELPEDIFPIKHKIFFEPGKAWIQKPDFSYTRVA